MDFDPRLDEMRAHRAFRDLQLQRPERHAIVVADLALLLDAENLVEIDPRDRGEGRARLSLRRGEARIVLGQIDLADEDMAASTVVIPASLSSLTSRSCSVPNIRSERPRACGE